MATTGPGTAHHHLDSRGKWVTQENPHTHTLDLATLSAADIATLRGYVGQPGTPPAATSVPDAPTGLVANPGNTVINLSWLAPAYAGTSAITGYRIRRGGVSLVILGVVLTYQDTEIPNGTLQTYTVAAINAVGEGAQSSSASATPAASSSAVFSSDFTTA